jgi:hypothetical protein
MNSSVSAKIYAFPPRGRFALPREREAMRPAVNAPLQPSVKIASGDGWYHDEAIEAERRRKN